MAVWMAVSALARRRWRTGDEALVGIEEREEDVRYLRREGC